jgi:hypothetical protein
MVTLYAMPGQFSSAINLGVEQMPTIWPTRFGYLAAMEKLTKLPNDHPT